MSIEAMKQALEALEHGLDYAKSEQYENARRYKGYERLAPDDAHSIQLIETAIASLRQAIAEAEKQEQGEPVGEMTPRRAEMFMSRFKHEEKMLGPNEQAALDYVIAMLVAKQEQGEPVAWMYPDALCDRNCLYLCTKGFTQFPECATTPQQRKPLTFEQVEDCFPEGPSVFEDPYGDKQTSPRWLHGFARAIEAAHGITKETP